MTGFRVLSNPTFKVRAISASYSCEDRDADECPRANQDFADALGPKRPNHAPVRELGPA